MKKTYNRNKYIGTKKINKKKEKKIDRPSWKSISKLQKHKSKQWKKAR